MNEELIRKLEQARAVRISLFFDEQGESDTLAPAVRDALHGCLADLLEEALQLAQVRQ